VHVALCLPKAADTFVQKFDEDEYDEDGTRLPTKAKPTSFKSRPVVTVTLRD